MKAHLAGAIAIFMLGVIAGRTMVMPASVETHASLAQVSPFDLTLKAKALPIQASDAI